MYQTIFIDSSRKMQGESLSRSEDNIKVDLRHFSVADGDREFNLSEVVNGNIISGLEVVL